MKLRFPFAWALTLAVLTLGCESVSSRPGPPAPSRAHVPSDPSSLRGRLTPAPEHADAAAPVLVYLEPINALLGPADASTKTIALRRRGQGLEPSFVLAYLGQDLVFSNQDDVHHALFSYSEPNAFELGTLGIGETERIRFSAQGAVRFYCSLHESEHGLIFVAPSQHLALPDARGEYALIGVPPGRYRLRTFSDGMPSFDREITLHAGESAWREIDVGVQVDEAVE